jgi:chemotaxis protein MotB
LAGGATYTNWELSSDRANSARQLMQAHGLRLEQVAQVRGFADRQLRHRNDPAAASNRRVSIIVHYLPAPPEAKVEAKVEAKGETKGDAPHAPKAVTPPKK